MSYTLIKRATGDLIVKNGGVFQRIKNLYIKNAGVWEHTRRLWINDSGVWKSVSWELPVYELTITDDEVNIDLYAALASQDGGVIPTAISAFITLNSGKIVGSADVSTPSGYFSSNLPVGSVVKYSIHGAWVGAGGRGGHARAFYSGEYGEAEDALGGGTGLSIGCDSVVLVESGGILGGGGGGGASGAYYATSGGWLDGRSLGGGGGAGSVVGVGGDSWDSRPGGSYKAVGDSGTLEIGGLGINSFYDYWGYYPAVPTWAELYAMARGGDLGAAGPDSLPDTFSDTYDELNIGFRGAAGAAGAAIKCQGFSCGQSGDVRGASVP